MPETPGISDRRDSAQLPELGRSQISEIQPGEVFLFFFLSENSSTTSARILWFRASFEDTPFILDMIVISER